MILSLPHYSIAYYTVQTIPPAVTSLIAHPKHGHTYMLASTSCLQVMREREKAMGEQLTELHVGVGER